jgi:hypothetical protein
MIDVDALRPGPPWAVNRAPTARRSIAHLRRAIVNFRGRRRRPSAAPHGIDFRAVLDRYGNPHEWVFCDHEGNGVNRDENLSDCFHRVEKSLA